MSCRNCSLENMTDATRQCDIRFAILSVTVATVATPD
jgi:hypothetical protein